MTPTTAEVILLVTSFSRQRNEERTAVLAKQNYIHRCIKLDVALARNTECRLTTVRELPGVSLHIMSMDLRTESYFYSHRTTSKTRYAIVHKGQQYVLNDNPSGPTEVIGAFASSRYGYEASYANQIDVTQYYDTQTNTNVPDPIKVNLWLDQFELWPTTILGSSASYGVQIAAIPPRYDMVTSASGTALLLATLPDGQIVNWHSDAPNQDLSQQVMSDLSGGDVLPVMTH